MKVEVRADGAVVIEGYVNAVGRDSRVLNSPKGKFVEQVSPGAFKRAIARASNVKMLLDHDKNKEVANTANGTLELYEDSIGLYARATISDDENARETAKNKGFRGWSFGFYEPKDEWENETRAGVPRRILTEFEIDEVSAITNKMLPCYTGTSIETRGEAEITIEVRAIEDDKIDIIDNHKPKAEECDNSSYKRAIEIIAMKQF